MFDVNDYIMYGVIGACQIIDIKNQKLNNIEKKYYVLRPIYSKNTIIKIPVDNEKISMRRIISKDEIEKLINSMPNKEILWIDDEKIRSEEFKTMLKSGKCDALITLIKSIYLNKKNRKVSGKKIYKCDEEIMEVAEKLLNEEFAIILDISPKDVPSYILNHISEENISG